MFEAGGLPILTGSGLPDRWRSIQVIDLSPPQVSTLETDGVFHYSGREPILLLAGRDDMQMCELSLDETGLKIFQIFLPGWFPRLHGGEQDRVRAVQPRHFPRQHWRLPWPLAWSWSSSARTDPGATNLKAGSLENLLILTLQCKKSIGNWNALAEILF